jgi:KDO2-lipid IV(A) lauroyltransferase
VKDVVADQAYGVGWQLVRHLPESLASASFRQLADQTWRRRGGGVEQLERNLARVVPDASPEALRDLSRAGMRSYFRYWCEAFRLPEWGTQEVLDRIVVHDEHRLRDAQAAGDGVVVALGHLGNWDHAGAWAAATGIPFTTVAERLRPESLFRRFLTYRESLGMEVLPLTGGGDISRQLMDRLGRGRVVALVADRDLSSAGLTVDLLGLPARFPAGPAVLSLRAGSPLVPALSWYDADRTHLAILPRLEPPAELGFRESVQALTQQFADVIGAAVRRHPVDWHMLQRVWTADLDPARLARSEIG